MRTGTTMASDLSAISPAPSYTFIRLPVTVMRPSGKMTRLLPALTSWIRARVASGLVGSSGKARPKRRNGFTHQRLAIVWSIANSGGVSVSDMASAASRKLTWLSAMIAFDPPLAKLSRPRTSSR